MENKLKQKIFCSVPGCINTNYSKPSVTFFRTQNRSRAAMWLERIHATKKTFQICSDHFAKEDMELKTSGSYYLSLRAMPILNLPKLRNEYTNYDDVMTSQSVQTDQIETAEFCTQNNFKSNSDYEVFIPHQKKKLLLKIKRNLKLTKPDLKFSKYYPFEMYKYEKLVKNLLPENLRRFIRFQQNLMIEPSRHEFTNEYKKTVLHLYYTSYMGYTLLQKPLFLPTQTKLKNIFTPRSMAVDEHLMQTLKCKVNLMTDEQKQCTLCVNVVTLKPNLYYNVGEDRVYGFHEIDGMIRPEPAKVALVAMACGLYKNWEQLVSMVFLANSTDVSKVQDWVSKILSNLLDIGLNVRAFVTDIDTAYTYIFTQRFPLLTPYIIVNDKKIYVIFDVPHLMKAVRNTFMFYNMFFGNNIASWGDLLSCYEHDKKKDLLRLLPKITDAHIEPNDYQKDDTTLAVQVLSSSLSAVMSNYVDLKILNDTARGTSLFLLKMNNLFDMLNSDSKPTNNNYKKPFSGNEFQNLFLTEMMAFFREIIFMKTTENDQPISFIEGFQTTISSTLQLYNEIQLEYSHLYTRKLNSDNLNKYLMKIIEHEGEYPTVRQLTKHFKEKFTKDILKSPVKSKSSDSMEDMMIQAQNLMNMKVYESNMPEVSKYSNIKIDGKLYRKIKIPDEDTLIFLAGFLFKQCYNKHSTCAELHQHLSEIRVYKASLTTPMNFINFINLMEETFRQYFLKNTLKANNILEGLLNELDNVPYEIMPCSHFPVLFAKKIYARLRIFMMLKFNNKNLK